MLIHVAGVELDEAHQLVALHDGVAAGFDVGDAVLLALPDVEDEADVPQVVLPLEFARNDYVVVAEAAVVVAEGQDVVLDDGLVVLAAEQA